jgi:PHP family Zn ribbon phosphoesterase
LHDESPISYVLQTEIIITADIGNRRKGVHNVVLFPSFESVERTCTLLEGWGVKNTVGRPFLCCEGPDDVACKLSAIYDIDDLIEVVPAHVMTPEGVFGSKAPVESLHDFYGDATELLSMVETGLSADPQVLAMVPELDRMTLISNSDAHSPALHRMGREFTTIDARRDYESIIKTLRRGHVIHTAEFNPSEGRYFLTGHRAGRKGHEDGGHCIFSPRHTPSDGLCPICGKPLTMGVLERAGILSRAQGEERTLDSVRPAKPFVHMVPLVEIIAHNRGISSVSSKKVISTYLDITTACNECDLWFESESTVRRLLAGIAHDSLIEDIIQVKKGNFTFRPTGYDGEYGTLVIGERDDVRDVATVSY